MNSSDLVDVVIVSLTLVAVVVDHDDEVSIDEVDVVVVVMRCLQVLVVVEVGVETVDPELADDDDNESTCCCCQSPSQCSICLCRQCCCECCCEFPSQVQDVAVEMLEYDGEVDWLMTITLMTN